MDHNPYHHGQRHQANLDFTDSRYLAPLRPPPPPPPHYATFHGDPNPYPRPPPPQHHHQQPHHQNPYRQLPPPSSHRPPQLPPPQYRPPPPMPQILHHAPPPPPQRPPPPSLSYHHNHHHGHQQRLHEVNFLNSPPRHHHEHGFDFPPSPRVPPNQGMGVGYDRHYRDDDRHRFYLPEPPRVSTVVSPIAPPISSGGLDRDHETSIHRPVDFNRVSPLFREIHDGFRHHDIRSPIRFGDDLDAGHGLLLRSDELGDWRDDRRIMDDVERERLEDHRFHDQYHPEMLPREFELNSGGGECVRRPMIGEVLIRDSRDGIVMDDDVDVRYDVQASQRDVSCSPIKFRNRGINRDDGFREFYEEGMNNGSESGRYSDRGRRQDMQDYSRTPRKNLRKKSAFLRIQPLKHSSYRNRHDATPSPHKGKESLEVLGHRMSEKRVGSPVELDVSFKSNSLVAKAIMAGPSGSEGNPNDSSTLNDLDIRIDSKNHSKAEGNRNTRDSSSVSRKLEKHSENRVRISPTLKRVGLPSNGDVSGSNSESPLSGSSSLNGDSNLRGSPKDEISDKGDTNAGLGKISSPNLRKKRKSNILISRLASSPSKANAKLVNVSSSADHPSGRAMSDECIKHRGKESSSGSQDVGSTKGETTIGTETMDANASPIVVVQDVRHTVSEAPYRYRMKKKGMLGSPLDSSGPLGPGVSEASGKTNRCAEETQTNSNTDEDVTKSVDKFLSDTSTEDGSHEGQIMVPVLVDNVSGRGSSESLISMEGNVDKVDIPSLVQDKHDTKDVINSISSPIDAPIKIQYRVDVTSSVGIADKPCGTRVTSSLGNGIIVQSCGEEHLDGDDKNEDERKNHDFLLNSSKVVISSDRISPDGIAVDSEKLTSESDLKATNDIQGRGEGTVFVSGADREGPSKASVSAGGDLTLFSVGENAPGSELNRKRKSQNELQYLNSRRSVSSCDIDANKSFLMMNSNLPVEKLGSTVLGLPCCMPESDVPLGTGLKDTCSESMTSINHGHNSNAIGHPSRHSKKIKIVPLEPILSDASASQNCDLSASTDSLTSMAEVPSNSVEYATKSAEVTELSDIVHQEKKLVGGAINSLQTTGCSLADGSNANLPHRDPYLSVNEKALMDEKQSSCLSCKSEGNVNLVMSGTVDGSEPIALESEGRMITNCQSDEIHRMEIEHIEYSSNGPLTTGIEHEDAIAINDNLRSASYCPQLPAECTDDGATAGDHIGHGCPVANVECEDKMAVDDNLPSESDCSQLHAESTDDGATTNLNVVGMPSNRGPSGTDSLVTDALLSNAVPALNLLSDGKLSMDAKKSSERLVTQGSLSSHSNSFIKSNETNANPGISAAAADQPFAKKNLVPAKNAKNTTSCVNPMSRQFIRRNVLVRADASFSSAHASSVTPPNKALSTYPAKPRTWRRTDNLPAANTLVTKPSLSTAPPQRPPVNKNIKVRSTSYIRKGNSLVRNPASGAATLGPRVIGVSINQSKATAANNIQKITGSSEMMDTSVVPDRLMTGGRNTHVEMPKTPPLPCSGMVSDHEIGYSGTQISSPPVGQSEGIDEEEATKSSETAPSSFRDPETDVERSLEDPGTLSDGNFPVLDLKRVDYIKRKSNQLIAASNSSKPSVHKMYKAPALSLDNGYYKRRKNQLIRASSESNIQQIVAKIDDGFNSQPQKGRNVYSSRNSTKRQSNKAVKHPKVSLVWKLGDTKSSGKGVDPLRCGKILSHLLPWKRATYWRSAWQRSTNSSSNVSLMITRKLLSPRRRAAIYVRSGRGFSLRRSKVISLVGSSLKWSKSMEKRSKKVDEEAAQAIAAMDSMEKPKTAASGTISGPHSRNRFSLKSVNPGERIFRIGMFRYRMDPSRRTLQRISDEVSSDSATSKPEHGARKTYVPKRLLIGSDEYVRIGNGNQLVRDPKRRTRILASEKVRWSLHTARMRLAKKRKFCQFFTRFGKCNKGEGKCPYIHDPSKIAVCTKFLNGLCSNPSCKLTHKIIPERMPDCSFFLQGSCSNENCPYRHVNVNPKAPICESFLRGYCAEGNECRKKHSYICPEFEATGSCPQGSKCKLYHPKKGKGKKRKTSKNQRSSRGRYFGSGLPIASEPETDTADKLIAPKSNLQEVPGELGDFIGLDVSDDEPGENGDPIIEQLSLSDDEAMNYQVDDLDELIKPLRILDRH